MVTDTGSRPETSMPTPGDTGSSLLELCTEPIIFFDLQNIFMVTYVVNKYTNNNNQQAQHTFFVILKLYGPMGARVCVGVRACMCVPVLISVWCACVCVRVYL